MGLQEGGTRVRDHVQAEMVDCPVPDPEPGLAATLVTITPEQTPVADSADATIEQTGADPPPQE